MRAEYPRIRTLPMAASVSLRAITHRLTTTPVNELPYVASYLAASLSDCSEITASIGPTQKTSTDGNNSLQLNKLKTRLTSLLQDRSFEGRWAGVVLIKAILEVGRWDILRDCGPWVRGLLAILSVWKIWHGVGALLIWLTFMLRNRIQFRRRNYRSLH